MASPDRMSEATLAEVSALDPNDWPAPMTALTALVLDEIQATHPRLDPPMTRRLACRIVTRLLVEHGGDHWYIPKPGALTRAVRDLELWAEHDGTVDGPRGIHALARRHGLSPSRVWAILKAQKLLRFYGHAAH